MARSMREAWAQTLVALADEDDRIAVFDGDLATSTKSDIFAAAHPDRFFEMGIAEQNLVGAAVGFAQFGYIPWLSSFTVFLTHRAADQVRMLVAQTLANVKIAGSYSGLLTGLTGKTHVDVQDLAIMRAMPDMTVLAPADATECELLTRWASEFSGPVYIRLARDAGADVTASDELASLSPRNLRRGNDVVLVSTGAQTARTVEAADQLAEDGISASVVHIPCLKPLDPQELITAIGDTTTIVTVEEHSIIGGLGGLVAETLMEAGGGCTLHRIGVQDVWGESAPNDFILDKYGLSSRRVADRVVEVTMGARASG